MARPLVDDELWALVAPLIPVKKRRFRYPGRKPMDPRKALTGILFVLTTGIPWEHLPKEMGCGSGMSCWRYLRDWQKAGVWAKIHRVLLDKLHAAGRIDWSRAVADSSTVRAVGAGEKNRPQSHRSRPARHQAPYLNRRPRHPLGRGRDGRQRQRRDPVAGLGG